MKKTSMIILTLVASLSISLGSSAQTTTPPNPNPPDDLYEPEGTRRDTVRYDTLRSDSIGYNYPQGNVYYNYYYRNRFYNGLFRVFFPRRYYAIINTPGYVPRRIRSGRADIANSTAGKHPARGSSSGRRGGFGHLGTSHTGTS